MMLTARALLDENVRSVRAAALAEHAAREVAGKELAG
jgi:hypothetical protein